MRTTKTRKEREGKRKRITTAISEKTFNQIEELMERLHHSIRADVIERAVDNFYTQITKRRKAS